MVTRRELMACASVATLAATVASPTIGATAVKKLTIPVTLFKNPGSVCCDDYAAYLGQYGFSVTVKESDRLATISAEAGIPPRLQGCHTAFIDGYVVDGHVPIEAIDKLLADGPRLKGLTVPGMPPGSPGMPGDKQGPLTVYAVDREGHSHLYMKL